VDSQEGTLLATYETDEDAVGAAPYFTPAHEAELVAAVEGLLSCTVEMNARVTGNAELGKVEVDGKAVAYGGANGWELEAGMQALTLNGEACATFKSTGDVQIRFPCDPDTGRPVAEQQ
jgi:hypothetical protein